MSESPLRVEIFSRSRLFSGWNRTMAVSPACFPLLLEPIRFSRAFRGAASQTTLRRRGAFRESANRFAAPTRSGGVSRSASSPAAFSVPFLAGQKGDILTGTINNRRVLIWRVCRTIEKGGGRLLAYLSSDRVPGTTRCGGQAVGYGRCIGHIDNRTDVPGRDDAGRRFWQGISRSSPKPSTAIT
jgi:hypothetical protein